MGSFSNALKTSVVLAIVLVDHAGAARVKAALSGSDFVCPSECLECSDSTWFGGLFGKTFKCILRNPEEVPQEEGRECQTPKIRECRECWEGPGSAHHLKTQCKYIDSEDRATEKKCSSNFKCCCSEDQNWNEDRCFAGAQKGAREEVANHNNKVELFVMSGGSNVSADAQLFTNMGACKREGSTGVKNTHHVYNFEGSIPSQSGRAGSVSSRSSGCCLATKTTIVNHHWDTTETMMGNPPYMVRNSHSKQETYTTCTEHELLHYCSNDEGLTASGEFKYKRVTAPVQGICLGDQQSTMVGDVAKQLQPYNVNRGCPKDMFSGKWCACNTAPDPAQKGCSVPPS